LNCRAAAGVEQSKLNSSSIRAFRHDAAQSINLAYQMSLGDSADRRIARHLRDAAQIEGKKRRLHPHPGCRHRRLAPRMAAAYHNHIKNLIESHRGLALTSDFRMLLSELRKLATATHFASLPTRWAPSLAAVIA